MTYLGLHGSLNSTIVADDRSPRARAWPSARHWSWMVSFSCVAILERFGGTDESNYGCEDTFTTVNQLPVYFVAVFTNFFSVIYPYGICKIRKRYGNIYRPNFRGLIDVWYHGVVYSIIFILIDTSISHEETLVSEMVTHNTNIRVMLLT